MSEAIVAQQIQSGMTARQDFSSQEITAIAETSAQAIAARERAMVEASYTMALRRPRDLLEVRDRLLKECRRPGFAGVARYSKPVGGKKIEGFSIRFAEAAARCMTNLLVDVAPVYDTPEKRMLVLQVIDMESNYPLRQPVILEKTVERRALKDGQEAISSRTNSVGQTTYLVRATEDDLLVKQGAAVSKAMRNSILRMIPGDILDDCEGEILQTLKSGAANDPAAARNRLADAFSALGVSPSDLKAYMGHALDTCQPAELVHLRQLYQSVKDGETTWREVVAAQEKPDEAGATLDEKIARKVAETTAAKAANDAPAQAAEPKEPEPPLANDYMSRLLRISETVEKTDRTLPQLKASLKSLEEMAADHLDDAAVNATLARVKERIARFGPGKP